MAGAAQRPEGVVGFFWRLRSLRASVQPLTAVALPQPLPATATPCGVCAGRQGGAQPVACSAHHAHAHTPPPFPGKRLRRT